MIQFAFTDREAKQVSAALDSLKAKDPILDRLQLALQIRLCDKGQRKKIVSIAVHTAQTRWPLQCVATNSMGADVESMLNLRRKVSFATFARHCLYDKNAGGNQFFKSRFQGQVCYYMEIGEQESGKQAEISYAIFTAAAQDETMPLAIGAKHTTYKHRT